LLEKHHDDLPAFYAAVRQLAALPKDQRMRRLEALMPASANE
jgi:predicted aminopeptidase